MLNDSAIAWTTKKQELATQCIDEAELKAANLGARALMYFKHLLMISTFKLLKFLNVDNKNVLNIVEKGFGDKTKHLEVKYLYIKHSKNPNQLLPKSVGTKSNGADFLTKNCNSP